MSGIELDGTVDTLRVALDRASRRANVAASNLANVDTPGYRALEVRFDDLFAAAPSVEPLRTSPGHLRPAEEASKGIVTEAPVTRLRNDGNTVDVDREMTLLASMSGRYQAISELVRKRFGLLVYAATDGRSGG